MDVFKLLLLLLSLVCVNAHQDNTETLEQLASELNNVKTDQTFVYTALDALETNLNQLVATVAEHKDEPEEKIDSGEDNSRKIKRYTERLKVLEDNVKSLKSFVDAERRLDDSLTELTTVKLEAVDDQISLTKTLTDAVKHEVNVQLGSVEPLMKSVKETADKRNFNLGGAIFYGGHGSACVAGNDDCRLPKTQCRAGQCQCLSGLSYDRKSQSCVEKCESYGLDFELVPNWVIRGNNSAVFDGVSLEECRQLCVNATEFECTTFEYFNWYDSCYLSEVTKLEEDGSWEYNSAGSYFQRNCN